MKIFKIFSVILLFAFFLSFTDLSAREYMRTAKKAGQKIKQTATDIKTFSTPKKFYKFDKADEAQAADVEQKKENIEKEKLKAKERLKGDLETFLESIKKIGKETKELTKKAVAKVTGKEFVKEPVATIQPFLRKTPEEELKDIEENLKKVEFDKTRIETEIEKLEKWQDEALKYDNLEKIKEESGFNKQDKEKNLLLYLAKSLNGQSDALKSLDKKADDLNRKQFSLERDIKAEKELKEKNEELNKLKEERAEILTGGLEGKISLENAERLLEINEIIRSLESELYPKEKEEMFFYEEETEPRRFEEEPGGLSKEEFATRGLTPQEFGLKKEEPSKFQKPEEEENPFKGVFEEEEEFYW
ncbi:MAG: hypothetical protein ABIA74_05035 [bacterium]